MKLAIGTKSPPKLRAIEQSTKDCIYFKGQDIELISEAVDSGVSDMPISLEEVTLGAKNRAHNVSKTTDADFYIGMEGGTMLIGEQAFLFGCVHIIDSHGEEHFGLSPMMEVPSGIQKGIYDRGEELGPLMSKISGEKEIKSKNGSFGLWSDDMCTRKDEFSMAFLLAISPFFNRYYK